MHEGNCSYVRVAMHQKGSLTIRISRLKVIESNTFVQKKFQTFPGFWTCDTSNVKRALYHCATQPFNSVQVVNKDHLFQVGTAGKWVRHFVLTCIYHRLRFVEQKPLGPYWCIQVSETLSFLYSNMCNLKQKMARLIPEDGTFTSRKRYFILKHVKRIVKACF